MTLPASRMLLVRACTSIDVPNDEQQIVFCDLDRFKLIDEKKKLYEDASKNPHMAIRLIANLRTANHVIVRLNETLCRGRPFPRDIGEKTALAITWNPIRDTKQKKENGDPILVNEMTQIQLCPWFVDWVKDRKIKLHKDAVTAIVGKAIIKATQSTSIRLGFAQIGIHNDSKNKLYANALR